MNKNPKLQYVTKEEADEMIENALRRAKIMMMTKVGKA